jgi:hypothetical protein
MEIARGKTEKLNSAPTLEELPEILFDDTLNYEDTSGRGKKAKAEIGAGESTPDRKSSNLQEKLSAETGQPGSTAGLLRKRRFSETRHSSKTEEAFQNRVEELRSRMSTDPEIRREI